MEASKLFLLVALGSLWSGCSHCLPSGCNTKRRDPPIPGLTIQCKFQGLTRVPHDIPPNADRVEINYNTIRTVTSLPSLPQLYALDLSFNSIESMSWESLCNLPALEVLYLHNNRLQHVKLNTVIEYLPKLKNLFLDVNKLVSCTLYELGWPKIIYVSMAKNPAPCACNFYGLTVETCLKRGADSRCSSCSACFFVSSQNREDLYCKHEDKVSQHPFSNVSAELVKCQRQQSMTRATTTEVVTKIAEESEHTLQNSQTDKSTIRDELKPSHPTIRATTTVTVTTSVLMDTEQAKTNQLRTYEKDIVFDGYEATVKINATQTPILKFTTSPTSSNTLKGQKPQIVYISIVAIESALTLMFIACFVRLLLMR
uniref:LRRCT domain-containing protein n=1 Tax=Branchiostoma floridae TaxID=7739 RepID=C3YNG1_BRAFL|eukprot:XP_002602255.1 hypothetical protein BRAFLDRAFT_76944 [Branchiostoma floridae]